MKVACTRRLASNMILRCCDGRNDCRVLDQQDRVVAKRRQHDAHGLGQDDEAHGLQRRHAERERGLHLAFVDRLNPGPVDLTDIGGAVDAEADDRGCDRIELDAEIGETEIDDEQLDQCRCAAQHIRCK